MRSGVPMVSGAPAFSGSLAEGAREPEKAGIREQSLCTLVGFSKKGGFTTGTWDDNIQVRGRAPVARQAHNLEVGGSIPPRAIQMTTGQTGLRNRRSFLQA